MAIETKEMVIGSSVFKINTYPTGKSVGFMVRLTKVLGESIPAFFAGIQQAPDSSAVVAAMSAQELEDHQALAASRQEKAFFDAVSKAVGLLVGNLDKENVPELIQQMIVAAQTQKDSQLVSYESDFAGAGISDLFQVLFFIVKENYGNVFLAGAMRG